MIHLQNPTPNWTEALTRLPDGAVIKAIDNVQVFREVKAYNPKLRTFLRHWYDPQQQFIADYEANKQKARDFFRTFIDGTFMQYAQYVDYIGEWNEYIASSHTAAETEVRVRWARAAADVWLKEYRTKPELEHIRLALCATAVGNDIPRRFAELALAYDCLIDYHAYSKYVNKQRDPGDFQYHSGRYDKMEKDWGLKVDWIFGEAGPYEGPVTGWRSSPCQDGDRDLYVDSMRQWIRDMRGTAAYQEGRIKGFCLFTTGSPSSQWKSYETSQPELNTLADMLRQEWTQSEPPPPPPPDPDERIKQAIDLLAEAEELTEQARQLLEQLIIHN